MTALAVIFVLFMAGAALLVFQMRQKIRRLESFRRELVANISHEFRTPLSAIKGYTETLLESEKIPPETSRQFLETIRQNSERLIKMMENLLELSRMENIGFAQSRVFVHLPALLKKIEESFYPRIMAKNLTWSVTIRPPLASFETDAGLLEIILNNLIDNAVKYSDEKDEIRIVAERRENFIQFLVADEGVGISPEDQKRIFERFYRINKDRSRDSGGTGLGLAIVKHAVQSLGGKIWVESAPGRGSRFYFTIYS